ncbi:Glucose-methanol-choline oxidoreductase [Penicillium griseofulvum]|uniref:glucose oxidase n=1 Tax=Penicillium patulum TaxID=5078 RepID=A0A135LMG9_PENPA|nr:Glucose-methanol-choline oxidoreductase [Penicillium griseofulvum]KXG50149.1 Glucose-methanol-choline oxidoreductase [Penicillium griseofulvum]
MRPGLSVTQIVGASLVANQFASALSPRTEIGDSYDFVIVGGGQAGLVLGARLSEDKNHTVLVLESGGDGDEFRKRIDTPAYSYFDSLWTTPLNWDFYTVAQPNANNREIDWPRGKVLGGSSAINGLYMTRPGEDEINAWKDMLGDMDGADNWSWESFYASLKKSETFTPPTDGVVDEARITWDASNHGTNGPIHTTYPDYTFPEVGDWLTSLETLGIEISDDMYGGETWGADVSTSCINPSNWTRSYSRSGYLDPLPERDNYDVLANAHVTRLLFEDSTSSDKKTASAVEYTTDKGSTKLKVKVNKEVILASGTIGSPAVLLYSGVGPKDVLSEAGVDLVSELPGVGQHLQDHFSATVKWSANVDTAGSIFYDGGKDKNDPKFLTYIDSAIAYVNSTAIYGSQVAKYQSKLLDSIDQYAPNTTYDDGVIAGYKAICNTTASKIFNTPTGQVELLFMNSDANGDIGITAAIQHPFSHGRIYINSSNPMDYPVIDPNYLANPADAELLLEGIKLARKIGETKPMSKSLTNETSPGLTVQSDEEWVEWLRKSAGTEFHPSSSCAMLPEKQGGVVDANLLVYGLTNVRVADASIIPISLSTHLMSSTYGVAEQASDIIRAYHNLPAEPVPAFSGSGSSNSTPSSSAVATKKSGSANSNGGAAVGTALSLAWTSVVLVSVHAIVGYGVFV